MEDYYGPDFRNDFCICNLALFSIHLTGENYDYCNYYRNHID